MKKSCFVLMAVCIGSAISALTTIKAQAEPIQLTYSNFFPAGHIQSQLVDSWCKEVETRTKGKVKIKYYPGGTLTKSEECYEGVVKGRSDLGMSVLAYTPGRFPVMGTVDLPLGYTSGKVATAVANEVYRLFKPKELSDTEVMYLHALGPNLINTRGKAVRRLEDMRGLRIRVPGISSELVIKSLGAVPIAKPMPQYYELLKSGQVNGALHPYEAAKGWKLAEVENYVTASYPIASTSTFFVVMNKDKWNSLPKDVQEIIKTINSEWIPQHGEAWDSSDREGMLFFLNHGGQITGFDSQEAARWKRAVAPIIDDYVKVLDEKGLHGRRTVDFTIAILNSMQ
ncbi:MAG: C4-dicarboxylate ABC transporter substrate-binding protein [Deltaproteobacteria bacterium RBG_13_52_11]|nr:MAG: C4-dicarboxylate ABC transporter substrate-binding protein [Deltaproteobacteria bacterium RBG_13_52_11]